MPPSVYDYILKLIIVGDSTVGKSNILSRFTSNHFRASHDLTIGVDFAIKTVSRNNTRYKLQCWDTAGQESFRALTRSFYRGTHGCLVVYDITSRKSFESLSFWIEDLKKYCEATTAIVLVGNKSDLIQQREVSTEEGKAVADHHGIPFFEISAKTGANIHCSFDEIVDRVSKKIFEGTIKMVKINGSKHINTDASKSDTKEQQPNIDLNKPIEESNPSKCSC
jgi:small GTP-binding protein